MSFLMSGLYNKWIDDFEHNNLTGYYSGDTGSFGIQSTTVNEGSYALEGTSSGIITSRPGDGLDYYPSEGDYFKIKMYMGATGSQQSFCWCAQDEASPGNLETMYYVALDNTNTNCNVWSYDSSAGSYDRHILADYGSDMSGQWLTIYLEHRSNGDHYVEVLSDDESTTHASGSGTPALSLTSGAIKYWWRDAGSQYYDAAEIVN